MAKDYYAILGVDRNSSEDDIKKAFRKLAHKYHPDKQGGDDAKFKEISEAYNVLSDKNRRAEYDSYGRTFSGGGGGPEGGFGGFDFNGAGFDPNNFQGFDFGDIFGDIFGARTTRARRGRDISIDIEVAFKDSVFGTERTVLLTKTSVCDTCNGNGAAPGSEFDTCTACNGNGTVHEVKRSILGTFDSVRVCDTCYGRKQIPKEKCKTCRGMGVARKEEEVKITIPPNVNNGEMIRLSGAGEAIPGGTPGDLYVKLHVKPDKHFKKKGYDLMMDLDVKLTDALLGSEYAVETLDGKISVKIPAGASPNEILRVRGKGIPVNESKRGDLLIKLIVELPKKLSRRAKTAIEELRNEGI